MEDGGIGAIETPGETARIVFWRRLDVAGLERLSLCFDESGITADAHAIVLEQGGLRIAHRWVLQPDWSVSSVSIKRDGADGRRSLSLQQTGGGWLVDGTPRGDLDGALSPDLSITPFCNSFPIRTMLAAGRDRITLDVAFIDAATMTVSRSRQSYERLDRDHFHYRDLGIAQGFEADISVDGDGIVKTYQGLFERVYPK